MRYWPDSKQVFLSAFIVLAMTGNVQSQNCNPVIKQGSWELMVYSMSVDLANTMLGGSVNNSVDVRDNSCGSLIEVGYGASKFEFVLIDPKDTSKVAKLAALQGLKNGKAYVAKKLPAGMVDQNNEFKWYLLVISPTEMESMSGFADSIQAAQKQHPIHWQRHQWKFRDKSLVGPPKNKK